MRRAIVRQYTIDPGSWLFFVLDIDMEMLLFGLRSFNLGMIDTDL